MSDADLRMDEYLRFMFDHDPPPPHGDEWFWETDDALLDQWRDAHETKRPTELFRRGVESLKMYSNDQCAATFLGLRHRAGPIGIDWICGEHGGDAFASFVEALTAFVLTFVPARCDKTYPFGDLESHRLEFAISHFWYDQLNWPSEQEFDAGTSGPKLLISSAFEVLRSDHPVCHAYAMHTLNEAWNPFAGSTERPTHIKMLRGWRRNTKGLHSSICEHADILIAGGGWA